MKTFDHMKIDSGQELDLIYIVPSFLSLIGTSTIILILLCAPSSMRKNHELLFWLSVADLFRSASSIFDGFTAFYNLESTVMCTIQGITAHTSLIPLLWVACIVTKLLLEVKEIELKYEMALFHSICWGAYVVQVVILSLLDEWGSVGDGGYCWIKGNTNPFRLMLYIPIVIVIIYCFVSLFYIYRQVKSNEVMTRQSRKLIRTLFAYPVILVFIWIAWIINRIQNVIQPDNPIKALYTWAYVTNSLHGALNALVFVTILLRYYKGNEYERVSEISTLISIQ